VYNHTVANKKQYKISIMESVEFGNLKILGHEKQKHTKSKTTKNPSTISQSIVVACVARPGSCCIIKHFLPYLKSKSTTKMADGFFNSFMYLYYLLFAEFHMFKPLASSPGSGEFYVVARGFHDITPQQRQLLLDYQANFTINKPMFAKQDMPKSFITKVSQFIIELQEIVILNGNISCDLIDYCYSPSAHNKTDECKFSADPQKFFADKEKDIEAYIDKYRIARIDKLKKHYTLKNNHKNNKTNTKRKPRIIKEKSNS
jgi:hypothetical protein